MNNELKDISIPIKDELLSLDNIISSKANLRKCVEYQISHSNDLLKYLYYANDNPLSREDIDVEDEKFFNNEIKNVNVYFSERTDTTDITFEEKSFIEIDIHGNLNGGFGTIVLGINILVHQSLEHLFDDTDRIDMIELELCKILDKAYGKFLGRLELSGFGDLNVPAKYRGERLIFKTTDFNR